MVTSKPKLGMPYAEMPIAQYLNEQIEIQRQLGKSQREIAFEIGYDKPTMISMFMRGEAKVPLEKVPALARALGVEARILFRLALQQYWKADDKAIAEIFGDVTATREKQLVQLFYAATKGADLEPDEGLERKIKEWTCEKLAR
jgi:transcriptional regulator with XRE-family HTH domain